MNHKGKERGNSTDQIVQASTAAFSQMLAALLRESLHKRTIIAAKCLEEQNGYLANKDRKHQEVQKAEDALKKRQAENAKLKEEMNKLQAKLHVTEDKIHKEVKAFEDKLRTSEQNLESKKRQYTEYTKELQMLFQFQENLGISYCGIQNVDGDSLFVIGLTKIHPHHPSDEYYLCFSKIDFFTSEFIVQLAQPTFESFENIANECQSTKNLKYLIETARKTWLATATGKGTPRYATPGNRRRSIGHRRECLKT